MLVSGRVQGVFFRDTCRKLAQAEGVGGWARNLGDGRLEACFEGAEEAVDRMVAWCREGPAMAEVDSVEVFQEEPQGESSFTVT